jgi:hypothetical protein
MPLSSSAKTRLEFQHLTIRELIEDFSEQQLKYRMDPSKWSAFENIVHLATYQPIFLLRLDRILSGDSPAFTRYRADDDPQFSVDLGLPLIALLDYIDTRRAELVFQLQGMNEDELSRTGVHPVFGKMTVVRWTEFFLLHEAHHIYTIFRLLQQLRKELR